MVKKNMGVHTQYRARGRSERPNGVLHIQSNGLMFSVEKEMDTFMMGEERREWRAAHFFNTEPCDHCDPENRSTFLGGNLGARYFGNRWEQSPHCFLEKRGSKIPV